MLRQRPAEAFSSSPEWEVLARGPSRTPPRPAVVIDWCYWFYTPPATPKLSCVGMMSPINYERAAAPARDAA